MFDDILISRNKKLNELFKLGSFLSRSLRENVELFKYDDSLERVYFITESGHIISGVAKDSKMTNIEIQDTSIYLDSKKLNVLVESKISNLIGNLYTDKYSNANKDLNSVLSLWNERLKIDKLSKVLEKKSNSLTENKNILNQSQTKNLIEIIPSLVKFLKENKIKISKISEIKNGIKLSNTIANAFSIPKITCEQLLKDKKYEIPEDEQTNSIYNLITRQELIKKELLESKNNFNSIWISNDKIKALAESITKDEETVQKTLSEVFCDVPYFAFLSKKQLTEMFNLLLNPSDEVIPLKNVQEFSSYIFELKKPVKNELIKTLDEKYGINIQNLKEPATFRSLLNTQIVIFETICKLLPKGSPQKPVIKEFITVLKEKNGVEAIDVNDLINKIFTESGYSMIKEDFMHRYLDFDALANELMNVSNVLKVIKGGLSGQGGMPGQSPQMPQMGAQQPQGGMGQSPMAKPALGMQKPQMGGGQLGKPDPTLGAHEEDLNSPAFTPDDAEGNISPESGQDPSQQMPGQTPPMELGKDQLMAAMAELEELMGNLKVELGQDPMQPGMEDEGGLEPEMGGQEPGIPGQEPDGDEGFVPGQEGEEGEMPEEEGEEAPPMKKKGFPPKGDKGSKPDKGGESKPSKGKRFPPKKDKKPTKESE